MKPYDAGVLLQSKESSDFFDQTVANGADPKQAANWMNTQVNGYLNEKHASLKEIALTPANLAAMIKLISDGTISSKIAKKVFAETVANGTDPQKYVEENGMAQLSDESVLAPMVKEIVDNNPQSVEDYKNGKTGQSASGWANHEANLRQANPKVVNKLLADLNAR